MPIPLQTPSRHSYPSLGGTPSLATTQAVVRAPSTPSASSRTILLVLAIIGGIAIGAVAMFVGRTMLR